MAFWLFLSGGAKNGFVSRAKALPVKRSGKGFGDENTLTMIQYEGEITDTNVEVT